MRTLVTDPRFAISYLESDETLRALLPSLRGAPLIAFDTEAASFHRYDNRIYLLQLSTRGITAVIDPLKVDAVPELGDPLGDRAVEIVFHDADFDLRLLDHDYQLRVTNIFDTRIAAQLLNEPGIGLAALLEKYQGIRLDKRFQRADWSRRPLEAGMLEYAATDTHYLPSLRDTMREQLIAQGRLAWAAEEFALLEAIRWTPPDDEGFWKIKGARKLRGPPVAVLRELYQWRDGVARAQDRAPFRIMNNDVMMTLAEKPPADSATLRAVKGVGAEVAERRGTEVLAAIARGLATPPDELPRLARTRGKAPEPEYFDRLERLKQARNAAAVRVGLQPGVLCANYALEAVARAVPKSRDDLLVLPELRHWQVEVLADDLLRAVTAG